MLLLVLLCAIVACVDASQPNVLSLACSEADAAQQWINGALDATLLVLETLYGGWNCAGQLVDACYEEAAKIDAITCIEPTNPECFDGCHLENQIVVDDECCKNEFDAPTMDGDAVCRTNRKWLSIAFDKLYMALDAYDAESYALATELACAAEKIFSAVLQSLGSSFLLDVATYRHIVSPQSTNKYDDIEVAALTTLARTVQSFRDCTTVGCHDHVLIATYTLFRTDVDGSLPVGVNQLLWPIGGTMSAFDKTGLPADSRCAVTQALSSVTPTTNVNYRLPTLGHIDYARVVQSFSRCSGFPVSGCVQGYHDLSINRCCNTLTLVKDIGKTAALLPTNEESPTPRVYAFAYVAHYKSKITYESDPTRNNEVELDLFVRTAAADACVDRAVGSSTLASADALAPQVTTLAFASGESRCFGGSDSGKPCTARNSCGSGLACVTRPGTKTAYCFDGDWWNEAMPCTPAGSQCPYGDCYGAVSGTASIDAVWQENSCDDPRRASFICKDSTLRALKNGVGPSLNKVKRV